MYLDLVTLRFSCTACTLQLASVVRGFERPVTLLAIIIIGTLLYLTLTLPYCHVPLHPYLSLPKPT